MKRFGLIKMWIISVTAMSELTNSDISKILIFKKIQNLQYFSTPEMKVQSTALPQTPVSILMNGNLASKFDQKILRVFIKSNDSKLN